jgi:hypothetical protein
MHDKKLTSFNILSFKQIGMADPFKCEPTPCCYPDLGYAEERYMPGISPSVVYIPTK